MITGPVGAGKSTLLKAVLGEISCEMGSIQVETRRMAYCSQTPWLPSCTVQEAICGGVNGQVVDEKWYKTVIDTCALTYDIPTFSAGNQTRIGSRGVALSGGQKQRIALARALYARPKIAILDDVLSALDKRTKTTVVERLLGDAGIFQKIGCTVILVTHASQSTSLSMVYLPYLTER
jgi:ABC-type bacteriocin/lantibiotic exporter with double-glycine peptidase domain